MGHRMKFVNKIISLEQPQIMGILNVTPDSFSDGGRFNRLDRALRHAELMVTEGATFIDVGGESTRPGAAEVPLQQELDRVIPVVEALRQHLDCVVSVDTSKPQLMLEAARAGAGLINDVRALSEPGALQAAADAGIPVCLMHMQGQPRTMQDAPAYRELFGEVRAFLEERVGACEQAGIARGDLLLDPGFGFGKTLEDNYRLLHHLSDFHQLGLPLLVGLSRKSMIGNLLGRPVDQRLAGSLACALLAAQQGAAIIRVHDVAETRDVLHILQYCGSLEHCSEQIKQ